MAKKKVLSETEKDEIVERIAKGERVKNLCDAYGISPNHYQYVKHKDTLFSERILEAEKIAVQIELENIPDILTEDPVELAKHTRWKASKIDRDKYGEKLDVNVNNKLDLSDILVGMKERVAKIPREYLCTTIDVNAEKDELDKLLE